MALDPTELLRAPAEGPPPPRAPLAGTRSQSMQRLQIGFSGLAAMVLLVGLADIIISNVQRNEAQVVPEAAPVENGEPARAPARDPLADAGVVPDAPQAQRTAPPAPVPGDDSSETP